MITKNIVRQPKSTVEVQISAPWQDISAKWDETLNKLAQETEVPGFRKGQAPVQVLENYLGNKLQEEFFRTIMPSVVVEALQGSNVVPIDYPKYQLISFTKAQPLVFKASFTIRPEIKVGNYKALKVSRPPVKQTTEQDVNKVIDDLFKRWKAKQTQTTGGVNPNIPIAPDDVFAKAVGALDLADLKNKLRTDLETEAKYNNELDFEEAILQEIEKLTEVDIPEVLISDELNRMLVNLQRRVADMGLLLDDYLKSQNETLEGIKNKWRVQAEKNVKMELGLSEVAKQENVQISDAELQSEIDKIQDGKLKAQFESQEPRMHLRHSLRQIRTLDLLKNLVKTP